MTKKLTETEEKIQNLEKINEELCEEKLQFSQIIGNLN